MHLPGELDERCGACASREQAFGAKTTAQRARGEVIAWVPATLTSPCAELAALPVWRRQVRSPTLLIWCLGWPSGRSALIRSLVVASLRKSNAVSISM